MDDEKMQVAFQTRMGEQVIRMTSTLVETIQINYEDFNESFLTCGTCLCTYNGADHTPKLLPCSHTVCLHCLGRIVASAAPASSLSSSASSAASSSILGSSEVTSREVSSFRCPICRELIKIPRGGVPALPPSFLVNQLLDLMASQRREVIPKCSTHFNQELLFCETCDSVFCSACASSPHTSNTQSGDHTVIPFSIAIKRMSEILLYKANECVAQLDEAGESVSDEISRLNTAADAACDVVNKAYEEATMLLEKRRSNYITQIRELASEKKEKFKEQLELINKEKGKVRETCDGLEYQVEVRHITKRIAELSSQLDSFISLKHPRENAFLICRTESDLMSLETAVSTNIRTSTTYPPLCDIRILPTSLLCAGVEVELVLETRDYHNQPRKEGGDPVKVQITTPQKLSIPQCQIKIEDNDDGSYNVRFTPSEVGAYQVQAEIFGRPTKEDNFFLDISEHNNPLKIWGRGELCQPVSVAKSGGDLGEIFVLDTGNARICVLNTDLALKRVLKNEALEGRSCTGIAYCGESDNVLVVNWRSKYVTKMSPKDGTTLAKFTLPEFVEPIGISVDTHGNTFIADNGARTIFVFDSSGVLKSQIRRDSFGLLGGVAVGLDGRTVIVADVSLFILNTCGDSGKQKDYEIKVPGKGRFSSVAIDPDGIIIATRTEKTRSFVQVFKENILSSTIDSFNSKLKRPSDVAIVNQKNILVIDLGNDCVKQYRYK